jgi:hypothetical protein
MTNGDDPLVPPDSLELRSPFPPQSSPRQSDLADVLQRVLDTGVVLVGDVGLVINGTEILSLRVRLLVASIDKSEEVGLDWWRHEPAFSSVARRHPLPPPRLRLARHARRANLSAVLGAAQTVPSP